MVSGQLLQQALKDNYLKKYGSERLVNDQVAKQKI